MSEGTWRVRAPRSVIDPYDSQDNPIFTPLDRRWLWRLEGFLAIHGTNRGHRTMAADLREYLAESCDHHFIRYTPDPGEAPLRQCIWCKRVEWQREDGAWAT
jgi:hypothetical protein